MTALSSKNIAVLLAGIVLLGISLGCSPARSTLAGLYTAPDDSYLILQYDGTFQTSAGISGNWQQAGSEIRLSRAMGTEAALVEGKTIRWRGTLYVRK